MLKKILRAIAWAILIFLTFVSCWILAALLLPLFTVNLHPIGGNDVAIYIQTNGDHTDIVVPVKNQVKDWNEEISYQNTKSRDTTAKYVAIGWGDKGFYLNTPTWAQLKFSVAFKAAFALSTSAVHTTFCKQLKEDNDCKKILISNEQYKKLVAYIDDSFIRDTQGKVINIKTNANYDDEDAFYEAKGNTTCFLPAIPGQIKP